MYLICVCIYMHTHIHAYCAEFGVNPRKSMPPMSRKTDEVKFLVAWEPVYTIPYAIDLKTPGR